MQGTSHQTFPNVTLSRPWGSKVPTPRLHPTARQQRNLSAWENRRTNGLYRYNIYIYIYLCVYMYIMLYYTILYYIILYYIILLCGFCLCRPGESGLAALAFGHPTSQRHFNYRLRSLGWISKWLTTARSSAFWQVGEVCVDLLWAVADWKKETDINPLVNCPIAMENHHFSWENSLFLWPCSIAILT